MINTQFPCQIPPWLLHFVGCFNPKLHAPMADDDLYVYYMPDDVNDTRALSSHKPPDKSAHDLSNHAILVTSLKIFYYKVVFLVFTY